MLNANNPDVAKTMMNAFPNPYNEDSGKAFIANADTPIRLFAIEIDGKAVGGIGLHQQQDIACKNMELGYWLGHYFERRRQTTGTLGLWRLEKENNRAEIG